MEHGSLAGHLILVLWGFAFGIPFAAMNSFTARLTLGAGLAVLMFAVWTESAFQGSGWFITYYMAFLIVVGSFCAASMKALWRSLASWLRRGSRNEPNQS
jgi:hypothetical protein